MRTVVIGGGAAGMAAAITAARAGAAVTVLERMDRVGKKILATGNGRCNLMNMDGFRYPGGADFARSVLEHCGAEQQRVFWQGLGLRLRTEDGGRVYPVSGQASTVLDALRLAMDTLGVETVTGVQVDHIVRGKRGFKVCAGEQAWHADTVIVAGGGCAQPKLGSDGSTVALLESFGHHTVPLRPALTQIITDAAPIRGLSGIRTRAEVTVVSRGRVMHRESGEVLFADYGVSGVCVMQCARFAEPGSRICLNLLPSLGFADANELQDELHRRKHAWRDQPLEKLLTGLCVPRLASALCHQAGGVWKDRRCGSFTSAEAAALAETMACFALTVKGVKGFDSAQVSAGGVRCGEFEPTTCESRLIPGLYAAGEVLDVDGDCGGFNLMFAFGSGMVAGAAAAAQQR